MDKGKNSCRRLAKHFDVEGHAHFLTFSCWKRQAFLSRDRTRTWFLENLQVARRLFDLWAFVIMPEHVHLLLLPHEGATMGAILRALKQPVAQHASCWVRHHAPESLPLIQDRQPSGRLMYRFWQPGPGYDRNMWSPKELREKVDYIHANPIRRKLVDRPGDWLSSSYRAWETGEDVPVALDRESFPILVT